MVFSNKKKEEVSFDKVETIIGTGTHFQGVISSQGTVRIDGTFTGEVKAQGDLVIGESGALEANIDARNVLVSGEIKGNMQAKGKVEITPSGKVIGDIKVKNLIIDEGAIFKGACVMDISQNKTGANKPQIEEAAK
ncbi:MAG: bactofilin family protein [Peptococcaceae bacterium]